MYCESCGTPINDGQTSCYKCGAPILPELVQTEEKDKVLIDLTAAEQKLPPFVNASGSQAVAKKVNVFAYISLFLGIVIMIFNILIVLGSSGSDRYFANIFIAMIADIVFSCIGFIKGMSITEGKPIAIAGLVICIIDFILFLVVCVIVVPPMMDSFFGYYL